MKPFQSYHETGDPICRSFWQYGITTGVIFRASAARRRYEIVG